jgi:hypothetical protein
VILAGVAHAKQDGRGSVDAMWTCIGTVHGITPTTSTSASPTRARHINVGSKSTGTPTVDGFDTSTLAESLCLSEHPRPLSYEPAPHQLPKHRFWSHKVMDACRDHGVEFSITVRHTKPILARIATIDEDTWVDIDYTQGGVAQVAETTLGDDRLIVRRTKIVNDPDLPELFASWRHHAFVTNRSGDAVTLDADHRAHAVVELAIRDLKHGAGLNHCPSKVFNANAAWLVATTLAHNLVRWVQLLGVTSPVLVVAKTLRRRLLAIPGRLTRSARRWTLHLPTGWPWAEQFLATLRRLRAIPAIG